MKRLLPLVPPIFIVLILDGATKIWAERTLDLYHPQPVLGDFFRLTLGYNTGVAFGLFANIGIWPVVVTGAIIVGLVLWLGRALHLGDIPRRASWPAGLLLGGAIANFVDRLPDGRVTDFLDAGFGAARWPAFNLADSFIVTSLILLMLMNITPRQDEDNAGDVEHPGPPLPKGEFS